MDTDRVVDFDQEHTGIPPYDADRLASRQTFLSRSDPTSLQGVMYAGRGDRLIYDRRPDSWITVNAYLFSARYGRVELEFHVNPEFESRESARASSRHLRERVGAVTCGLALASPEGADHCR